jgi:hypothetical protein
MSHGPEEFLDAMLAVPIFLTTMLLDGIALLGDPFISSIIQSF